MKKWSFHSLKTYSTVLLLVLMLLFTSLIGYNNYAAFRLLRRNVYANTMDTLTLYQKSLNERLSQTETYLRSAILNGNTNLSTLQTASRTSTSWYTAYYRLAQDFRTSAATYTSDCFFCYLPEREEYFQFNSATQPVSWTMKDTVISYVDSPDPVYNSWSLVTAEDRCYFFFVLSLRNTYTGSIVSMETLLNSIPRSDLTESRLYFSTEEGELLRDFREPLRISPPDARKSPYEYYKIEDQTVLPVSYPLEFISLFLTMLVPESEFSGQYSHLTNVLLIVSSCFLFIWLIILSFINRFILKPVATLTGAIKSLQEGDLDTRIPEQKQPEEFHRMTRAFNSMVGEIKDLKIDVYERKLQRERLETQYLKQQITPHFMINCLNTAYQLTETNHPDLARKMLRDLSSHLRYTLSSGQTVRLSEELNLLRNYIDLSCIRYPGSISYFPECPEEFFDATIVPLMILNFVENTIKYEVVMGEMLEIHVEITSTAAEGEQLLHFSIWDTGNGFSEEKLKELNGIDTYAQQENYHIGIINVYLRAKQVFRSVELTFSNRPGAGAQISMTIPYRPFPPAVKEGGVCQ